MRLLLVLFGTLLAHLAVPPSPSAGALVRLQADHIAFYYNRFLVEADGHVRVTTSDGTTITGDAFSMDLKLDRFLIASHVHLTSTGGSLDGAAIADFLSYHRIYFVPVIAKPDRWTYVNGDFKNPLRGREMPGDVFYFPDLHASSISLTAKSAVIGERAFARFQDVRAYAGALSMPLPSFYVYFGANRYLSINSLSGANFDATWNAAGNNNSITALHARYDSANKGYFSFEQHLAGERSYAVVSDNPATIKEHFWNLVGGDSIGSRLQVNLFTQLETTQKWFKEPESASIVNYASATQAFNQSFLNAYATFTNYNLVNNAYYDHPSSLQLTWTTFNHRIGKTPFYESLNYGLGFNHNSLTPPGPYVYGLQTYGGVYYTTIWNHVLGYTFYLPSFKFGDKDDPYKEYNFSASLNESRQWFSVPHHYNVVTTTASIGRTFSREVNAYVSYSVNNTADIYNKGGYVPYAPLGPNGQPDLSYLAFRGAATLRTAATGITYSANPNFLATVTYAHHDDFPIAVPGVFPLPPLNNIGQFLYSSYFGQPPNQLTGEVRVRLLPHLSVDVARTYYFNFGTIKWSPQFIVQFSQ